MNIDPNRPTFKYLDLKTFTTESEIEQINKRHAGDVDDHPKTTGGNLIGVSDGYFQLQNVFEFCGFDSEEFAGEKIVVLGPGNTGLEVSEFDNYFNGASVEIVDINEDALVGVDEDIDRRFSNQFENRKLNAHLASVLELPFEDESVALFFHSQVFDSMDNMFTPMQLEVASNEIARVVKSGGHQISVRFHLELNKRFNIVSEEDIQMVNVYRKN